MVRILRSEIERDGTLRLQVRTLAVRMEASALGTVIMQSLINAVAQARGYRPREREPHCLSVEAEPGRKP